MFLDLAGLSGVFFYVLFCAIWCHLSCLNKTQSLPDGIPSQEDVVLAHSHTEELCLIYSGGCVPRAGRVRRVPLGAKKVETAVLRFPAQRTKIKTTKKENFTSCGEATTFQGTFSGVTFRPVSELPLIAADEKKKIFPAAPAVPAPEPWKECHGEDVPLFWQEAKPIEFYLALLDEFKGQAVLDLTAGSGALMEACLTRGIQYHGVCLNREHMSWLQAVADRAACGLISIEGSTLYAEELAKSVKQHFADVLQKLVPADDEAEELMEPETDDDAA